MSVNGFPCQGILQLHCCYILCYVFVIVIVVVVVVADVAVQVSTWSTGEMLLTW
jgi:hypothetical protein